MEFDLVDNASQGTVIKVVGVGGAGGNAIQHMINQGVDSVQFIAANTDAQALATSKADNIIQIGDSGLGAGMRPDVGRQLAEESRARIEDALRGANMVFIAAGMGGGTGTGASPIVAEVAKSLGALTVAVVTKPFSYEGNKCMEMAEDGIRALSEHVDSLIVILNEKLEDMYEDDTVEEWFAHADDVLTKAVAGIAEIINVPGHVNVDFNDVKTIMGEQGKAMMGTAVSTGENRAQKAAEDAVAYPLLEGINLSNARGVLVNITANRKNLKGKEIKTIMSTIREFAAPDATIVQGIAYSEDVGDEIRVTVVATGIGNEPRATFRPDVQANVAVEVQTAPVDENNTDESTAEQFNVWHNMDQTQQDMVKNLGSDSMDEYDVPAFLRNPNQQVVKNS